MVAPECKLPIGIRHRDIMKLVSRTNRRFLGYSHGITSGEGSQLEGREEEFSRNGGGSPEHEIGGEGAERGSGDVISTANIGLHSRHSPKRESPKPTNVLLLFSVFFFLNTIFTFNLFILINTFKCFILIIRNLFYFDLLNFKIFILFFRY